MSASCASVVKQFGLKADSVALIPNGIDLAKFASNPDRILLNRPIKIGMMANLRKIKQIDLLVQAAHQLRENPELEFVVAGEGECRSDLESLIGKLNLVDRFQLLGRVPSPELFLKTLEDFVTCSAAEGLSNSVLEAMASGLAICSQ